MKKRIISAIVMLLIAVPLLIIGHLPFAIFVTTVGACGLYELLHMREEKKEFPFLLKIFAYLLVMFFILYNRGTDDFTYYLDYRVMAFIMFFFLAPMVFINDKKKYNANDAIFLIGSTLFVGLAFNLILQIRNYSLFYIIYLFLITIFTDIFAMEIGKRIGKTKMAEAISPNKTWEGSAGGIIMGTFVASTFYLTVVDPSANIFVIVLLTMFLSAVGQLGDLVFSSIKRYYGKKDFSNLIPGHGGILDRLDSIIFVALAFIILFGLI